MEKSLAHKIFNKLSILSNDSAISNNRILSQSKAMRDLPDGSCFSRLLNCDSENNGKCDSTIRMCEYIGSFPVSGSSQNDKVQFVRTQLKYLRDCGPKKTVLLVLSFSGIKVCSLDGKSVLMAHALRRISFVTCDPESRQFSFLAREPNGVFNLQYCHSFVAKEFKVAEELSEVVGSAFRMAYAQQLQQTPLTSGPRTSRRHARSSPVLLGPAAFPTTCRDDAIRPAPRACWSKQLVEKLKFSDSFINAAMELSNNSFSSASSESANISPQQSPIINSNRPPNLPVDFWSPLGGCSSSDDNMSPTDLNSCKQIKDKPILQKNVDVMKENVLGNDSKKRDKALSNDCVKKSSDPENTVDCSKEFSSAKKTSGFSYCKRYTSENSTQTPSAPIAENDTLENTVDQSNKSHKLISICSLPSSSTSSSGRTVLSELSDESSGCCSKSDSKLDISCSKSNIAPPPPERYDSLYVAISEEKELRGAPWFQAGIPREIALEILNQEPVGSFMVRESTSKPGCFALSLRVPREFHLSGTAHYLIMRTNKGYKIKGFTKEFGTLSALITHHSVMPELLPCPLSLSRYNPSYRKHESEDFVDIDEDSDYNLLSDFRRLLSDIDV